MELGIDKILEVWKPRALKKQSVAGWQYKFFKQLEPNWNSVKSKPLEINMVRGWLKRFNQTMLPTIYTECERSNNFSATFWGKWKKLPPYKAPKKPKQKKLL